MAILTASNLSKSYGHFDIFDGISLEVPHRSKIALIGPNGSGKTTLLRLMLGLDSPTSGAVQRMKKVRIGYLPQHANLDGAGTLWDEMLAVFEGLRSQAARLRALEHELASGLADDETLRRYGALLETFELAGGYTYERRIGQVLSGLGFVQRDFTIPVYQLSGGQRTRALLARLLLEEPDLLVLDEPTNHLDLSGIEWLESYLASWKDSFVVVAHDRAFLDATVEHVWELDRGRMDTYRGNYSAYVAQRAERRARQATEYRRQQQFIARTEDYIARNMAGQLTRQAQGRKKRLDRMERLENVRHHRPMSLSLGEVARSGDLVLGLYNLKIGYEANRPLASVDEMELRRTQRVALLGANGSGKTTLLRTITGQLPALTGRVRIGANVRAGYLAQGYANLRPELSAIETILATKEMRTSEARSLLGRYRFSGDDVFKLVGDLSGGEQARIALAILALQGANLLLLDEPTNHLDVPSQEVLQEVLASYPGTLLIVTHDRYLISKMDASVWALEDGTIHEFSEGYQQYRAWLAQRSQGNRAGGPASQSSHSHERDARRHAERRADRLARRQAELETAIHALEVRLAQIEVQLAAASQDRAVESVTRLGEEYTEVERKLNTLLSAWSDHAA